MRGRVCAWVEFTIFLVMILDEDDDVPEKEKSEINREHMKRVSMQMAAEEEALKFARIIRGVDTKKYKNIQYKYVPSAKQELSDRKKLELMRLYQFLIGFMGFLGVGMIFFSIFNINDPTLHLSISKNFVIKVNLLLPGCALAIAGVLGIIGFQHKHDKISDRIHGQYIRIETKRKST